MYNNLAGRGLYILAFPCNQFGGQESWEESKLKEFVTSNLEIPFPVLGKVDVKGDDQCTLYRYLKEKDPESEIEWNFAKYLLDGEGNVVKFFPHRVKPEDMISCIEPMLIPG